MQDDLRYITFKQFIYTVNIRQYYNEKQDATNIRIYPDIEEIRDKDLWFDFSWYDWANKDACWKILSNVLSEKILKSYITDIWLDENINVLSIRLENKPTESLQSLKN